MVEADDIQKMIKHPDSVTKVLSTATEVGTREFCGVVAIQD